MLVRRGNVTQLLSLVLSLVALVIVAPVAEAFESAKVLPKGVRNVNLRVVDTEIFETTNTDGNGEPLAAPLAQDLTFERIIAGEKNQLKQRQLQAFLQSAGFDEQAAVGSFTAELNGRMTVVAPVFAYGITDKLTMAVAVPIYNAATSVRVGFSPTATGQAFLDTLAQPLVNQRAAALDAGDQFNNAVGRLNDKLTDNGFRRLRDWRGQGIGDVTVGTKYRFFESTRAAFASSQGVVLPTGRADDPDNLTDIAFGDGQTDLFGQLAMDNPLGAGFTFNTYGKYTAQLPDRRTLRQVTDSESIEVENRQIRRKLGDKTEAGTSLQWAPTFGLVTGVGYKYTAKFGDVIRDADPAVKRALEGETDQMANDALFEIGYSTLPAFQRKSFPAPVELKLTYSRQLNSRNMPVTDLAQFDFNIFF